MTDKTLRRVELAHRYADLGDVRLHYVEAGQGPLVLLLARLPAVLVPVEAPDPSAGRGRL